MTRVIARWDPFREAVTLRDAMDRLLEESFVRPAWAGNGEREHAFRLPVDAYTTENEVIILASVPGVKPEDVEITIEGDTLTLRGEMAAPPENVNYVMQERAYGRFSRTLTLNVPVQAEKASAEFEHGVLTLTIPKAEAVRPRSIKVTAK